MKVKVRVVMFKLYSNFKSSRVVIEARRKQLTRLDMGNKSNWKVDNLFEKDYFGSKSPVILQRTVWWNLTNHFGFRARDESRKLCYGDIKLLQENGRKFLE